MITLPGVDMMDTSSQRGRRLPVEELRAEAGLSRLRLAADAGLSVQTIFNLERTDHHPKPGTVLAVAEILRREGCDVTELERYALPVEESDAG